MTVCVVCWGGCGLPVMSKRSLRVALSVAARDSAKCNSLICLLNIVSLNRCIFVWPHFFCVFCVCFIHKLQYNQPKAVTISKDIIHSHAFNLFLEHFWKSVKPQPSLLLRDLKLVMNITILVFVYTYIHTNTRIHTNNHTYTCVQTVFVVCYP